MRPSLSKPCGPVFDRNLRVGLSKDPAQSTEGGFWAYVIGVARKS